MSQYVPYCQFLQIFLIYQYEIIKHRIPTHCFIYEENSRNRNYIIYVRISCTDVYGIKDSNLVRKSEETEERVSWGLERSGPELNTWRV
jgi:hypothetical protein